MTRQPEYHYGPDQPHHPLRRSDGVAEAPAPTALAGWARRSLSPAEFLALTGGLAVLFGLVWVWVMTMPLAFLDPEYPFWRAKQPMLANCDLGDHHPWRLAGRRRDVARAWPTAANLAVGGGTDRGARRADRAMRCPEPPRRVILSLDAVHFTEPDLFWEQNGPLRLCRRRRNRHASRCVARAGDSSI